MYDKEKLRIVKEWVKNVGSKKQAIRDTAAYMRHVYHLNEDMDSFDELEKDTKRAVDSRNVDAHLKNQVLKDLRVNKESNAIKDRLEKLSPGAYQELRKQVIEQMRNNKEYDFFHKLNGNFATLLASKIVEYEMFLELKRND